LAGVVGVKGLPECAVGVDGLLGETYGFGECLGPFGLGHTPVVFHYSICTNE
jgi:hypothetical protein